LKLVTRLAQNSRRRLEVSIENVENALDTNVRITAGEREHYRECVEAAKELSEAFGAIADAKLPKPAPKVKRKIGRPSQREIAKAEAQRRG
jgi:hypothetical protein